MGRFILSGFADEIDQDLDVQLDVLAEHGIRFLELRSVAGRNILDHALPEVQELKQHLDERGFGVSAIGSPIGKISIFDEFPPHLERFEHALQIAATLAAPYIRVFSFFIPEQEDPGIHRCEVMRRMRELCDRAEQTKVILLHENEKGIYGDCARRCLDLVRTMDSPSLKITFDFANFIQCGERPYPDAYDLLAEHVAYLHIKDAEFESGRVVSAGYGHGRIGDMLAALLGNGFHGFLSLEPHLRPDLDYASLGLAAPASSKERFATAAAALKALLKEAGM